MDLSAKEVISIIKQQVKEIKKNQLDGNNINNTQKGSIYCLQSINYLKKVIEKEKIIKSIKNKERAMDIHKNNSHFGKKNISFEDLKTKKINKEKFLND